jgi:hypothetical protein
MHKDGVVQKHPYDPTLLLSFAGYDVQDIYNTFGKDVALGTRVRKLRHGVSHAFDLLTGQEDNPAGPSRTFRDGAVRFYVADDSETEAADARVPRVFQSPIALPASVLEGGEMHAVAQWLVYQTGPQCYLAAAVNVLFSVAGVRAVLDKALDLARESMPDVHSQYIMAGVFPSTIALPTGLAVLQVYVMLRARRHFEITPVLEALEMRLRPKRGSGGYSLPVFQQLLLALGFTYRVDPRSRGSVAWDLGYDTGFATALTAEELSVPVKEDFVVLCDVSPPSRTLQEVEPMAGTVLVGGFMHGSRHVVAGLAGGLTYDSNHLSPKRVPWERCTQDTMKIMGDAVENRDAVFVSTKLLEAGPRTVAARAQVALQAMFNHVHPLPQADGRRTTPLVDRKGFRIDTFRVGNGMDLETIWYHDGIPTHEVKFIPIYEAVTITWQCGDTKLHPPHAILKWDRGYLYPPSIRRDYGDKPLSLSKFRRKYPHALRFLLQWPSRFSARGKQLTDFLGPMKPAFVRLLQSIGK